MHSVFGSLDKMPSALNDIRMTEMIKSVYGVQPQHIINNSFGVSAFLKKNIGSMDKITSMPFNFYPPTAGEIDSNIAFKELIKLAKLRAKPTYVEFKTLEPIRPDLLKQLGATQTIPSVVSELNLMDNYASTKSAYKKQHRTNVNASKRNNADVALLWGTIQDLPDWFSILQQLYKTKHLMITQPYQLFSDLLNNGLGKLLLAKHQGITIGGIFILADDVRWEYSWGAVKPGLEQRSLSSYLIDYAIQCAISEKISLFGFGSSPTTDKNLRFFKSRWGCEEKNVYYYYWGKNVKTIDLNASYSGIRSAIKYTPNILLSIASKFAVKVMA